MEVQWCPALGLLRQLAKQARTRVTSPRCSRTVLLPLLAAGLICAGVMARPYADGLSFVVRAADIDGVLRRAGDLTAQSIRERELLIPTAAGTLRARAYEPAHTIRRTALLVGGLHAGGCDEPRLVAFARQLAASGVAVITPTIPGLSQFTITPALTDAIEDLALWLSADNRLAPDGRIAMMGVSFSGGLVLVAAGRPSLRGRVAYVFSFGGHDDLHRVLRYLCTGVVRGTIRPPHDYGVALLLLDMADRVVPADQVAALREGIRRFLRASYLDRTDKRQAKQEFAALRALASSLPEPSATLLVYVNNRDVAELGARLLPYIEFYEGAAALSLSRSAKPTAPVFLLHGAADNVIPADEAQYLADDLRGSAPVRLLLTDLVSHAEVDHPARLQEVLQLAVFWADVLKR
jgi:dienelactone hydrolase